jgi:hypothetical protein
VELRREPLIREAGSECGGTRGCSGWRVKRQRVAPAAPWPIAARRSAGSGLGVVIAKHIVQTHGGTIWAESTPGHGATFSFTIPLATPLRLCSRWSSRRARRSGRTPSWDRWWTARRAPWCRARTADGRATPHRWRPRSPTPQGRWLACSGRRASRRGALERRPRQARWPGGRHAARPGSEQGAGRCGQRGN